MKTISDNLKTILSTGNLLYFYLVQVGPFTNENGSVVTWRHTTLPGGYQDGASFFTDDHSLVHIDPPRQSGAVDRESFRIVYSDPSFAMRPIFEKGFSGVPVTIRLGFYNTTDLTLGGVLPNEPMVNDLITSYAGHSDTAAYSITPGGNVTATIECTSPMGALLMVRASYTNRESLRKINPNDTSYDELYVGSKGLTLLWGKKV